MNTIYPTAARSFLFAPRPNILRFTVTAGEMPAAPSDLVCLAEAPAPIEEGLLHTASLDAELIGGMVRWLTASSALPAITLSIRKKPRIVYDTAGEAPVVRRVRTVDGERTFIDNLRAREDGFTYEGRIAMDLEPGEAIYGLGQGEDGVYDHRGETYYLYQHNMRIPMPVVLSPRGWALFVDCRCLMMLEDNVLTADAVSQLDVYLIAGTPESCVAAIREITGRAALLPKWAYGFIQSREAYKTQEELVSIAEEYRRRDIPIDCVVQDWNTWVDGHWGEKRLDPSRYPDMPAAAERLRDLHVHSLVSVWPNMASCSEDHKEFEERGMLLADLCTYNAMDPNARRLYWEQLDRGLYSKGFDGWWCDSSEPFSGPDWCGSERRSEEERFRLVGNEHKKFLGEELANAYPLYHAVGVYENQRAADPDHRIVNLTRSSWASGQRYGTILWSGDICARWDVMRRQIPEGLNMSMSGHPYWTFDIGGFFVVNTAWEKRGCGCNHDPEPKWFWKGGYNDTVEDPAYRELYVRWMQLGCFMPVFRSHGTDAPREIWHFGKPGERFYDAIASAIRLRYELMPYTYSLAGAAALEDKTILRPRFFDFPEDPEAGSCESYLYGPSLLVFPVLEPMYYECGGKEIRRPETRRCLLPAGTDWYDWYTGDRVAGGTEILADAPLEKIPFFVRAGSVIPTAEGLRYAADRPEEPITLRVFPGNDGVFHFYDDAGDGYGYENGAYQKIPLVWDDAASVLTIGEGVGTMAARPRVFKVMCRDEVRTVAYDGKAIRVEL